MGNMINKNKLSPKRLNFVPFETEKQLNQDLNRNSWVNFRIYVKLLKQNFTEKKACFSSYSSEVCDSKISYNYCNTRNC